jgi:hypothetical protein
VISDKNLNEKSLKKIFSEITQPIEPNLAEIVLR